MTEVCRVPSYGSSNCDGSSMPSTAAVVAVVESTSDVDNDDDEHEDSFAADALTRSPRCEAYVMTGDKMLLLNPKISPSYAKARQDQLPPTSAIDTDDGLRKRGPFDDFPSLHHKVASRRRFQPCSQSDHLLNDHDDSNVNVDDQQEQQQQHQQSSVTVSGVVGGDSNATMYIEQMNDDNSTTIVQNQPMTTSKSEPSSPAKHIDDGTTIREKLIAKMPESRRSTTLSDRDADAACRLAKRLFALDGFKKSDIASHLAKNNDFCGKVAHEYLKQFNFAGLRLDAAIRDFLSHFSLTGETSERERVLVHFSRRYLECNPSLFDCGEDQVHTLTCALLLLNTDLHAPQNSRKRMTSREFVDNLSNTEFVYRRDLLKTLYASIKESPIEWASDDLQATNGNDGNGRQSNGYSGTLSVCGTTMSGSKGGEYLQIPDPESQVDYKSGWVMRKCVYDSDGKRTPFGRRSWKMFYATLKGMVLYLHRDERGFRRGQYQTFANAILVHHSYAMVAKDYNKKQHIFRLITANLGEFLFQTSDPQEVQSWIDAMNYVAAAFSSPALAAPVSSTNAFHKPLLPSTPSRLSMHEQIGEHCRKAEEMSEQLERLRQQAPPLKSKGKPVYEYFFKEQYLEQQRERYLTYVALLRTKLQTLTPSTSALLNSTLMEESEAPPDPQNNHRAPSQDRISYREAIGWSSQESE